MHHEYTRQQSALQIEDRELSRHARLCAAPRRAATLAATLVALGAGCAELADDATGDERRAVAEHSQALGAISCATTAISGDNGVIITNASFLPGTSSTAGSLDDVYTAASCPRNFIVEVQKTAGKSFEWVTASDHPGSGEADCQGGIYSTMFGYLPGSGWQKIGDQIELLSWVPSSGAPFGVSYCKRTPMALTSLLPPVFNTPYTKVRIAIEAHHGSFAVGAYDHKRVVAGIRVPLPPPT